jgi:hypothetical protein
MRSGHRHGSRACHEDRNWIQALRGARVACAIAIVGITTVALPLHAKRTPSSLEKAARRNTWLLKSPTFTGAAANQIRKNRALILAKPQTRTQQAKARSVWLSLLLPSSIARRMVYLSAIEQLRQDSQRLKTWIRNSPGAVVDVLVVGGGVHGLGLAYALRNPQRTGEEPLNVLVMEAGQIPAQNLALVGDSVRRNSASRATGSEVPRQQGGDRNPSLGLITTPDVTGSQYPPIGLEAELAAINTFIGDVQVLLDTRVQGNVQRIDGTASSSPLGPSGGYRVEATDGTVVFARKVVVTTGIRPRFAGFPQATVDMLKQIYRSFDIRNPDARDPSISVYPQSLVAAYLGQEGRKPYRGRREAYKTARVEGLKVRIPPETDVRSAFLTADAEAVDLSEILALRAGPEDSIEMVFETGAVRRVDRLTLFTQDGRFPVTPGETLRDVIERAGLGEFARTVELPAPRIVRLRSARDAAQTQLSRLGRSAFGARLGGAVTLRGVVRENTGGSTAEVSRDFQDVADFYFEPSLRQWVIARESGVELLASDLQVLVEQTGQTVPLDAADPLYQRTPAELADETTDIPEIAVIGGGDSGRTTLEALFGLRDESSYTDLGRFDVASAGRIGPIDVKGKVSRVTWIVGENSIKSCEEALQALRSRYLGLVGLLRENETTGLPTVRIIPRRALDLRKLPSGRVEVDIGTASGGLEGSIIADRVEVATGVEPAAAEALGLTVAQLLGLPTVEADLFGLGTRAIARETDDGVLVTGAGAGVVDRDETFKTGENKDSFYAYTPRVAALAELLRSLVAQQPELRVTAPVPFDTILDRRRGENAKIGGNPRRRLRLPPPSSSFIRLPRDPAGDELILRTQLARAAEALDWSVFARSRTSITFSLTPQVDGDTRSFELSSAVIDSPSLEALWEEMKASDLLLDVLQPYARRRQPVEVRVIPTPHPEDGKPSVKGIEMIVREPGAPASQSPSVDPLEASRRLQARLFERSLPPTSRDLVFPGPAERLRDRRRERFPAARVTPPPVPGVQATPPVQQVTPPTTGLDRMAQLLRRLLAD